MSDTILRECKICHEEADCIQGVCLNCSLMNEKEDGKREFVKSKCKFCVFWGGEDEKQKTITYKTCKNQTVSEQIQVGYCDFWEFHEDFGCTHFLKNNPTPP